MIQDELKNYPLLQQLKKVSLAKSLSPPDDYFSEFTERLLQRLRHEAVFSVQDELMELAPQLATQSIQSPYKVPQGYFEKEPLVPVLSNRHQKQKGSLFLLKNWIRVAAAAVLIGFMSILGWMYFQNRDLMKSAPPETLIHRATEEQLAGFLTDDGSSILQNFVNSQNPASSETNIPVSLEKFTDSELSDFLETTSVNEMSF